MPLPQRVKIPLLVCLAIATAWVSGCSSPSPATPASTQSAAPANTDLAMLQGFWTGREITYGREGLASLTITGQNLEYRGEDDNDWAKGTFVLREDISPRQIIGTITQTSDPQNVGKNIYSIYKIENGTLTITGGGTDPSSIPGKFDSRTARCFVFKHSQ